MTFNIVYMKVYRLSEFNSVLLTVKEISEELEIDAVVLSDVLRVRRKKGQYDYGTMNSIETYRTEFFNVLLDVTITLLEEIDFRRYRHKTTYLVFYLWL